MVAPVSPLLTRNGVCITQAIRAQAALLNNTGMSDCPVFPGSLTQLRLGANYLTICIILVITNHWSGTTPAPVPIQLLLVNSFQLKEPLLPRLEYQKCTIGSRIIHIWVVMHLPLDSCVAWASHLPSLTYTLLTVNWGL